MARLISFMNRKGGVGKSTLLTLTATALHQRTKKRVLVVDADLQSSIWNQRKADALDADVSGAFDVEVFSFAKASDVDIPVFRFNRLLESVSGKYDLILVDPAGTMEGEAIPMILTISDAVVIPIIGSLLDIQSTLSFLSMVEDVNAQRDNDLKVIGVVNKRDRTTEYKTLDDLEGAGGLHLLKSSISNRVEYRRLSTVKEVVGRGKDHEFNDYYKELTKILKL